MKNPIANHAPWPVSDEARARCLKELKKLKSKEAIIAAVCSTGLSSGPAYPKELFKGPALSQRERDRIAELLVPSEGYLLYRSN